MLGEVVTAWSVDAIKRGDPPSGMVQIPTASSASKSHRQQGRESNDRHERPAPPRDDQGPVVIALRPDLAPNHVARIKELARQGFYDGLKFHRVIDGFMAQTG